MPTLAVKENNMSIISIGVQAGGPNDGGIGKIKVDLYKEFEKHCTSTFCESVNEYAPVIRVDGNITQFGEEEITRLRFAKKQKYITADIQVPESVWKPKSKNQIRDYIASKVRDSIVLFVERLKKDKLEINDLSLLGEVDKAIESFLRINYE